MSTQLDLFAAFGVGVDPPDPRGMARTSDPDTSKGAAIVSLFNLKDNRRLALMALYAAGDYGATDFELQAATGVGQTSIGKRRGELRDAGLVRRACDENGKGLSRPSTTTGTASGVWCLTAAGVIAAETAGGVGCVDTHKPQGGAQ